MGLQGSWVWGRLIVRFGPFPFLAPFSDQGTNVPTVEQRSRWRGARERLGRRLAAGDGPRGPKGRAGPRTSRTRPELSTAALRTRAQIP